MFCSWHRNTYLLLLKSSRAGSTFYAIFVDIDDRGADRVPAITLDSPDVSLAQLTPVGRCGSQCVECSSERAVVAGWHQQIAGMRRQDLGIAGIGRGDDWQPGCHRL